MKTLCCTIHAPILAWMLVASSAFAAAPDLRQWTSVATVTLPEPAPKGLVELALPPEFLAVAREDLADIRLTTPSGEAAAYVLRIDRGEAWHPVSYRPQRLFNPVFEPGKQSTITADFGSRATRTRVDIDTPGTNFRRRVRIEASADSDSWQILRAAGWLFRIAADSNTYNKNQITLPDNDFRYLRITVFNAPDDPGQVPIRDVTAWYAKSTPPGTAEVPTRALKTQSNTELKATQIDVDLGYENLPLSQLALSFEDATFLRRVEVFGRNVRTRTLTEPVENSQPRTREVDEPWAPLGSGSVYRLPGEDANEPSTGLSLPLAGQCRYLRITIYNGDDAALKLTGLKVYRLQEYLGFHMEAAGPYRLYAGNAGAEPPQYDLAQFADRLRAAGVTEVSLGALTPNPLFAAPVKVVPWSERYAWLLWVMLAVVMAVLGTLVLRQARHARGVT